MNCKETALSEGPAELQDLGEFLEALGVHVCALCNGESSPVCGEGQGFVCAGDGLPGI